jgi:hypothetical protein
MGQKSDKLHCLELSDLDSLKQQIPTSKHSMYVFEFTLLCYHGMHRSIDSTISIESTIQLGYGYVHPCTSAQSANVTAERASMEVTALAS